MANHEAIIYSQLPSAWSLLREGAAVSVSVSGRLKVSAAEGLGAAVLADMGLTIASDWMFAPEMESGAVVRVLDAWSLPTITSWAVFPAGRMMTAKARQFAERII
nr:MULTISPECIES: LysR substrate-binding domain-containing protein [Gluconobacter]